MKIVKRIMVTMLVFVMLAAIMPERAFATESTSSTESITTTTTTTKADAISLSNLYIVGSNNKNYLADPSLTVGVDKYSFYVPDWMETATLIIKSSASLTIESDGVTFEGSTGSYIGQLKLTEKKNTFTVKLTSGDAERTLTVVVYLSNLPCKLESVSILKGSEVLKTFDSEPEEAEYTLPSGTLSSISLRIVPRHEQKVSITNLTGIPKEEITGKEEETVLTLHETYKRYDHDLTLVEGTNVFLIKVTAGTVEKTCTLTIIVGDAMANMTTTTAPTESTTASTVSTISSAATTSSALNDTASGGTTSSFPPVLWVTIGVVIAVVVGACIFMIINLGNRENRNNYDDYEDYGQQRYPVRRNLGDYVDDDYGYNAPQQRSRRSGGSGSSGGFYGGSSYNSNSYNNYTDGYDPNSRSDRSSYSGGYGSYQSDSTDYDDGYGNGTPRGGSGSLGGFESDDDYGNGNYYGGY